MKSKTTYSTAKVNQITLIITITNLTPLLKISPLILIITTQMKIKEGTRHLIHLTLNLRAQKIK